MLVRMPVYKSHGVGIARRRIDRNMQDMTHQTQPADAAATDPVPNVRFAADEEYHGLRRVLTYGTYDLLHYGHIRLLRRAAELGDYLIVALSTDEFNKLKGKTSFYSYPVRRERLEGVRYVDLVIPEETWEQKISDVQKYQVDVVVMGSDWKDDPRFEALRPYCDVVYLDRTDGISTTEVRSALNGGNVHGR